MVEGEPGGHGAEDHSEAEDRLHASQKPALHSGRGPVGDEGGEAWDGEPHPERQESYDRVEDNAGRGQRYEEEVEGDQGESAEKKSALPKARLESTNQEPLRNDRAHSHESEEEGV